MRCDRVCSTSTGRRARAWGATVALALTQVACGEGGAGEADDLAGRLDVWAAEPVLRIDADADPARPLTTVGEVRFASGGELLVSQPQDRQIRVYASDGAPLGVIGQQGEGPGELGSLRSFGLLGDTVFVSDNALRRVSFFTLEGEVLSTRPWVLAGELGLTPSGAMVFPAPPEVILPDGSGLTTTLGGYPFPQGNQGRETFRAPLLRIDGEGQPLDTVAFTEITVDWTTLSTPDDDIRVWGTFRDMDLVEMSPDGSGVVFVQRRVTPDAEGGTAFTVGRVDPAGDTLMVRSFPYAPVPVPDALVRRHAQDAADRQLRSAGAAPPTDDFEAALRRGGMVPAHLPAVSELVVTGDGSVWLRREDTGAESVSWHAFDADLQPAGTVVLPARYTITDARGDEVVGVELDAFDVPSVVGYRLQR